MRPLLEEDPRTVGPYRLLGVLGAGGMGRVYVGRNPGGRTVAVKVVHPRLALDEEFRSRFRREVETARRVGGAWTAPVLDADPDAPVPWVVTGYVAGPSLDRAVADVGPLPEPAVRAVGAGLAEALAAVHALGLVHRDVKPSNVLLPLDGPRLIDFGIARAMDGTTSLTATGVVIGSSGYMAPEQVLGRPLTGAADVFSLGAVLAFAAAGAAPFPGEHHASINYRVVHGDPELGPGLDGELRELVTACLAKDPADRPAPEDLLRRLTGGRPAGDLVGPGWLPAPLVEQVSRQAVELLGLEGGGVPYGSPGGAFGPATGYVPTEGNGGPPPAGDGSGGGHGTDGTDGPSGGNGGNGGPAGARGPAGAGGAFGAPPSALPAPPPGSYAEWPGGALPARDGSGPGAAYGLGGDAYDAFGASGASGAKTYGGPGAGPYSDRGPYGDRGPAPAAPGHGGPGRGGPQRAGPGRNGARRRAVLAGAAAAGAVVVVLAVLLGLGVWPFERGGGHHGKAEASAGSASPGDVPRGFVGTWTGAVKQRDGTPNGSVTSVIGQGRKGEYVVRNSYDVLGVFQCRAKAALRSATATKITLREVTDGPRAAGCTGSEATLVYTLGPDGTLSFASDDAQGGSPTATLTRSGG
ncbi:MULTISPECIES: serine/threonine-protein kinase [Streptomyces]|uniref:serine/threonine-protein kinase n=1 Tax=Streptomyces TaxID=1883 RepID=UPI00163B9683|nr:MULTISPECIES: serine/threonine-protein kinase [Streptomyces]MBC2877335.1 serine/threonine protein kinase [Streptomyces sp. TYQ1024]UBI38140.1 serine/threonine protein kinase [Streptomyces mobaraensis]UKW30726.1 serine/threonine protein kinase [Streptomyces sp. TYQ1024]